MADECFVSREMGILIQIFRVIDAVNAAPNTEVFSCPIDELLALRRADRVDPKTVNDMTETRRDEPVLIAELGGCYWVIDGNHRLARRHRDGCEDASVIEVSPALLASCLEPLGF